jgi:hypothetical protein
MELLKVGTIVRLKQRTIEGPIKRIAISENGEQLTYIVHYVDENGDGHQRHFTPDELELVPPPEEKKETT